MPTDSKTDVHHAAEIIKAARKIVALTGAGVSKESGIPTFREAQSRLWAQYEPEKLATPEGFSRDPSLVWRWYDWRRQLVGSVKPNPGHFALAELERRFPEFTLITQNVDGLHRQAGTQKLIEVHGSLHKFRCFDQSHPAADPPLDLTEPPYCECGSLIRPDIVWFGEALKEDDLRQSFKLSETADVFLVIGTSGLVQPAASFPMIAKRNGAKVIECNMEETLITPIADVFLCGPSGEVLPKLVALLDELD